MKVLVGLSGGVDSAIAAYELKKQGYKDITLLGQNVNSYGIDLKSKYRFVDLLEDVAKTGIKRIRFATSNPWNFDEKIIDTVVKCGTPVNERDNLGSTPLHMAVRWDATKSILKLLEMGIDVNAQNTSGKSALAESALSARMSTAKVLICYILSHIN